MNTFLAIVTLHNRRNVSVSITQINEYTMITYIYYRWCIHHAYLWLSISPTRLLRVFVSRPYLKQCQWKTVGPTSYVMFIVARDPRNSALNVLWARMYTSLQVRQPYWIHYVNEHNLSYSSRRWSESFRSGYTTYTNPCNSRWHNARMMQ